MRSGKNMNSLAGAVVDALTSQICVLDKRGTIIAVNRAWREFGDVEGYGIERTDIGVNYLDLCQAVVGNERDGALAFRDGIYSVLDGKRDYFQLEYPCHSPTEKRWFLARVSPLCRNRTKVDSRRPSGAVVSHADITERKVLETKLTRIAATDYLTGLFNRRAFVDATEAELRALSSTGRKASLLMFDIDHFKSINDVHGHQAGDEALQAIATICRSVLREGDLFARIGGEEFACFMPDTDGSAALLVADRLKREIAISKVTYQSRSFKLTVSIGISTTPAGGATLDQMLVSADNAMYRAKREGRDCIRTSDLVAQPKPSAA
ncbi:diguanylate cyclase [Aurantimonas sp. A2-1-M11]|uniref:sensor domain-containing diguanylate cyclase n=1 Tax=Aurantimonas sp. A2-1-M11 TaxID=3113712 RepID=UPI002F927E82